MRHYNRMFAAQGAASATLYHGPAAAQLSADGVRVLPFRSRAGLIAGSFAPAISGLRRRVLEAAQGRPIAAIVHSDLLLGPLRRMFPGAVTFTPCHSDKFARKAVADHVITLNPRQHELACAALPGRTANIHMWGNPFVTPQGALTGISDAPFRRIVFCARFVAFKEPLTLLQAYAGVAPPVRPPLTMYGDGPLLDEARRFAAGTRVNANFAGWTSTPWSDIGPDDLLVTPSNWEGLPYLLLEALSHGVPVLASDIAGNRLALNDGAFGAHFRTGDPADLSRALTDALARPGEMRSRAAKGAQSLASRFGANVFYEKLHAAAAATAKG